MVPLVRLELTLLAETDFESVASTNSATGANSEDCTSAGVGMSNLKGRQH